MAGLAMLNRAILGSGVMIGGMGGFRAPDGIIGVRTHITNKYQRIVYEILYDAIQKWVGGGIAWKDKPKEEVNKNLTDKNLEPTLKALVQQVKDQWDKPQRYVIAHPGTEHWRNIFYNYIHFSSRYNDKSAGVAHFPPRIVQKKVGTKVVEKGVFFKEKVTVPVMAPVYERQVHEG